MVNFVSLLSLCGFSVAVGSGRAMRRAQYGEIGPPGLLPGNHFPDSSFMENDEIMSESDTPADAKRRDAIEMQSLVTGASIDSKALGGSLDDANQFSRTEKKEILQSSEDEAPAIDRGSTVTEISHVGSQSLLDGTGTSVKSMSATSIRDHDTITSEDIVEANAVKQEASQTDSISPDDIVPILPLGGVSALDQGVVEEQTAHDADVTAIAGERKRMLKTLTQIDVNAKISTREMMRLATAVKQELIELIRATRNVVTPGHQGLILENSPLEDLEDHVMHHYDQMQSLQGIMDMPGK